MSESPGAGHSNANKRDDSDPILMVRKITKERLRERLGEEVMRRYFPEHDSSSSSTATRKNEETCANDDMKESKEKNGVPKENDNDENMIQSNDSMQELEESFVMVESFTDASPKTARFELVEKEEYAVDGVVKQKEK